MKERREEWRHGHAAHVTAAAVGGKKGAIFATFRQETEEAADVETIVVQLLSRAATRNTPVRSIGKVIHTCSCVLFE